MVKGAILTAKGAAIKEKPLSCTFCGPGTWAVWEIVTVFLRRNQLCDMAHDLVTDFVQLFAVLLAVSLCLERAERFADIESDFGASPAFEAREHIIESDQADRQ